MVSADSWSPPTPNHGVIPGGYVDLIFNLGDQVYGSDSGALFFDEARSFVVGPVDRFQRFSTGQQFELLGVRLHHGRIPFSSNLPLGKVRNQAIPLEVVCEDKSLVSEIRALESRLPQISETSQRIACVERFLIKFLCWWKEPDAVVSRALELIQESKGRISVKTLASALCVSDRQLERKFTQHVGLSPKVFCRIARFHRVKSLVERAREPCTGGLAYACGYYDQTHLIHEFKLFTGHTPARYERIQPVGFFLYDC